MQPARFRQEDILLVEINNAKSMSPTVSSGRSAGSFPEQRLVIEPSILTENCIKMSKCIKNNWNTENSQGCIKSSKLLQCLDIHRFVFLTLENAQSCTEETTFPYCTVWTEQSSRLSRPSLRIFEAFSFLDFRWLLLTFSVSIWKFIFVLATTLLPL